MSPIRVLMADPDECLLARYRKLLGEEFEFVAARTGLECLARLYERIPDVLVLEPRLPWGGGDGVLAMMHDDPQQASVPVMILTACRDRAVLEGVAPYRISDYYVKPLPAVRLAKRIRTVLDHRRSARPESPRPEFRIESRAEPVPI